MYVNFFFLLIEIKSRMIFYWIIDISRFLKSDGHQILIKWLSDFSTDHNHAFLLDTLNILGDLPFNIDNVSQNDIDELQLKIAELASAESGEEKGQCFWYKNQEYSTNDRINFFYKERKRKKKEIFLFEYLASSI
jgi:hypothetical protein